MLDGLNGSQTASVASQGFGSEISTASELQTDFLDLLIAQLQNQDPLSPMDNEAMTQQLATFSQLEQLERVNENLETQMGYSQSLNNTMMMDVAGKRVTVVGDDVTIAGGQPSRSLVRVPTEGTVYASIVDERGETVRDLGQIGVQAGFNKIEWDGQGDDGNTLPDGNYRLQISAKNRDGAFMQFATFSSGIVDTVQFEDNFVYFEVNGRLYSPASVVEVGIASSDDATHSDQDDVPSNDEPDVPGGGSDTGGPRTVEDPAPPTPGIGPEARTASNFGRSPWEALLRIR